MARQGRRRELQPRPPALPPETRTVGQVVAETIRFYGGKFWRSLALGLPVGLIDLAAISLGYTGAVVFEVVVAGPLLTLSFVAASVLVSEKDRVSDTNRPPNRTLAAAWLAGTIAFIPFPFLALGFILPGLAWLALVGLVVPVIVIERLPIRAAFSRAVELARADYVHALGSLTTLALTYFVTRLALFFTLRGGSGAAERTAGFLADLVLSPLIFLGGALLYFDQAARVRGVGSAPRSRRRDADVHPAVKPHRAGRPDAQVEPGPAARGQ
jgi:hypothetical protein